MATVALPFPDFHTVIPAKAGIQRACEHEGKLTATMTITNNITQLAAERLVSGRLPNERAIQLWLAMLLASLDYKVELEYQVADGYMDIFLPELRVVIETKQKADPNARRSADPDGDRDPDSKPSETQFKQCERYVSGEWDRRRWMLFDLESPDRNLPYKAILTDGRRWWVWQWEIQGDGLGKERRVARREFSSGEELEADIQGLIETPWQLKMQPIAHADPLDSRSLENDGDENARKVEPWF